MRVHLDSAYAPVGSPRYERFGRALRALLASAAQDRFGAHALCDDAGAADLVLFVENAHYDDDPHFARLVRAAEPHGSKAFVYNETDQPRLVWPGLYCSMPRSDFQRSRMRASTGEWRWPAR